jgi:hypothetical protein
MKNIHILPTDKPSRLFTDLKGKLMFNNDWTEIPIGRTNQHIYITADLEIKEGEWLITTGGYLHRCHTKNSKTIYYVTNSGGIAIGAEYCKKIILTTDSDLIEKGIQAIDNDFLEWFVKNPSCEYVRTDLVPVNEFGSEITVGSYGFDKFKYKIIIPQEEPKKYPIGGYAPGFYSCKCVTCKKEFMGDKRAVQCEPCAIKITGTNEESWDNIYEEYGKDEYPAFGGPFTHAMTFIEWLKLNYNQPTRKRK